MLPRPDLVSASSPAGTMVYQLTTERDVPSCHIYMEAQIFTPDSKRLVLHRSADAHRPQRGDPEHQYLLCDLENDGALSPLTNEVNAVGPSVSPDGQWLYYFLDHTEIGGGSLTLKRVRLDGTERQTVMVVDDRIPGTDMRPSFVAARSGISADGKRVAFSGFLRDGERLDLPWGLMVFEVEECSVRVVLYGNDWCDMHPQYCRAPGFWHDIMVQHNHGYFYAPDGGYHSSRDGTGADVHVIRDDGTDLRDPPVGRDGVEYCQGHQCWLGRTDLGLSTTILTDRGEQQLIVGKSAPCADHVGLNTPGAVRNHLTRGFGGPHFYHFQPDAQGRQIIMDYHDSQGRQGIYLADVPEDVLSGALSNYRYLVNPRSSWKSAAHPHPFLSPDGRTGFFNSDETGTLQAYMVCGW